MNEKNINSKHAPTRILQRLSSRADYQIPRKVGIYFEKLPWTASWQLPNSDADGLLDIVLQRYTKKQINIFDLLRINENY